MDGAVVGEGVQVRNSILGYGTWLQPGEHLVDGVRVEVAGQIQECAIEAKSP